jgi:hypothetical protein
VSEQPQGPDWWLASDGKWYPPQSAAAAAARVARVPVSSTGSMMIIGGSAAVVLGAFLPWATVSIFGTSVSKAGTSGDGILTLILCSISGALGIALHRGSERRSAAIWSLVLVVLAAFIAAYDTVDVSRIASRAGAVSVGFGLYLTDVGCVVAFVGTLMWLRAPSRNRHAVDDRP